MSTKKQFAPSALTRAAQGEIGARRDKGTAGHDEVPQDSAVTPLADIAPRRDTVASHSSATTRHYDLPLPLPKVKKEKPAHTSLYLPPNLLEWVKQYCFENDLSMNQIVCTYLEELRRRVEMS